MNKEKAAPAFNPDDQREYTGLFHHVKQVYVSRAFLWHFQWCAQADGMEPEDYIFKALQTAMIETITSGRMREEISREAGENKLESREGGK